MKRFRQDAAKVIFNVGSGNECLMFNLALETLCAVADVGIKFGDGNGPFTARVKHSGAGADGEVG